jgi:hypothetical protein
MRPLYLDVLSLLFPLSAGVLAFFIGRSLGRGRRLLRGALVLLALLVVAVGALSLAGQLPIQIDVALFGATGVLSCVALFLLGIVWTVPGRSFNSDFLVVLALLAECLLLIESSGHLWWRFCEPDSWQRSPDAEGRLEQSSARTCSPTAAAMLLKHFGVNTSEGEMAYLAGTTLLGTDASSIARALDEKARRHGLQADVRHTGYEACLDRDAPFLAHVRGKSFGHGHALLIEQLFPDRVEYLDPGDGNRKTMMRDEFEQVWDGTAVYLVNSSR